MFSHHLIISMCIVVSALEFYEAFYIFRGGFRCTNSTENMPVHRNHYYFLPHLHEQKCFSLNDGEELYDVVLLFLIGGSLHALLGAICFLKAREERQQHDPATFQLIDLEEQSEAVFEASNSDEIGKEVRYTQESGMVVPMIEIV